MIKMEEIEVKSDGIKIHHPFSMAVCGPTKSGKTFWVYMFLKSCAEMIQSAQDKEMKIMFCFSVEQYLYDNMRQNIKNLIFYKGIPNMEAVYKYFDGKNGIIVFDDLMYEIMRNIDMLKLFTQGVHHYNVSVIFMTQNVFQQGIYARTIALNVKYLILFNNPRDKAQIKYLGSQIYPGKGNILLEAYIDATNGKQWGYILIDLSSNCPEFLRMRTNVLPDESEPIVVYRPKIAQ